jgi:hypothetical protein
MIVPEVPDPRVTSLLARLKAHLLPGGEQAARSVRGIKTFQQGEIRSAPDARWGPLTAEESVDATRSGFCWIARMGSGLLGLVEVTDAYENGQGRLVVKKGPVLLKKMTGPEVDKGELQRYLGYLGYCPAMLVNHPTLAWEAVGPATLRIRDSQDPAGAATDMVVDEEGLPVCVRAVRPMTVGKKVIMTAWSARGSEFQDKEGMRVWTRMEAAWHLPEGEFTYVRLEVKSFTVLR